jgi:hypothetical protein
MAVAVPTPSWQRRRMTNARLDLIEIGYQVFSNEGGEEFGAVRQVRPQLVIYVENAGDFTVATTAVKAVHDGKVVLDLKALDKDLREAIKHAHERETPGA